MKTMTIDNTEKTKLLAELTERHEDLTAIQAATDKVNSLFADFKRKWNQPHPVHVETDLRATAGLLAATRKEIENIEHHRPQLFSKTASK